MAYRINRPWISRRSVVLEVLEQVQERSVDTDRDLQA